MSNFKNLMGGDSALLSSIEKSRDPGALFQGATWEQVGTDEALTRFIFNSMDPGDRLNGDISKLQQRLIQDVEDARGNALWLAAMDGPREYPSSIGHHQFLNLQERLYLSSPSGYGRKPYYGSDLQSVEEREKKVGIAAAGGWTLLIGTLIWMARRRDIISPQNETSGMSSLPIQKTEAVKSGDIGQLLSKSTSAETASDSKVRTFSDEAQPNPALKAIASKNTVDELDHMSPATSIATCLGKYADFSGRACRSEYWWFAGAVTTLHLVAAAAQWPLGNIVFLVLFGLPMFAAMVRRLRDAGNSPWWVLIGVLHVPGALALAVLCAQPSQMAVKSQTVEADSSKGDPGSP